MNTGLKRDRVEAERVAAKWEAELREGRYHDPSRITWEEFRRRYEDEVLSGLKDTTFLKVAGVFNAIERILNPQHLRDVTSDRLSYFLAQQREAGLAESTIAGNRAHLRAAFQWAVTVKLLLTGPMIQRLKRAKSSTTMKGRPITREEFERMLDKVEYVVGSEAAPSWLHYLEGLWFSGLRLEESLELFWDREDRLCVDLSGKHPMLRIPAELEKGHQDRVLPMAPEFANFLERTPHAERSGRVFKLKARRLLGERLTKDRVSRVVTAIGKAAMVKVRADSPKGTGRTVKIKYASAHDLRRSFGERWAMKVMPQVLMVLMRHESIETTMKFYVGRNAQTTAQVLWDAHAQKPTGNTSSRDEVDGGRNHRNFLADNEL
jgi:integrase